MGERSPTSLICRVSKTRESLYNDLYRFGKGRFGACPAPMITPWYSSTKPDNSKRTKLTFCTLSISPLVHRRDTCESGVLLATSTWIWRRFDWRILQRPPNPTLSDTSRSRQTQRFPKCLQNPLGAERCTDRQRTSPPMRSHQHAVLEPVNDVSATMPKKNTQNSGGPRCLDQGHLSQ